MGWPSPVGEFEVLGLELILLTKKRKDVLKSLVCKIKRILLSVLVRTWGQWIQMESLMLRILQMAVLNL